MQRYYSRVKAKDAEGNELPEDTERYPFYDESDLNPLIGPCGGAKPGRVHFDAEQGSVANVEWKVSHSDNLGNCSIRLGEGLTENDFVVLHPTDGSGTKDSGYFPCGRSSNMLEGKEIKFPSNFTCDDCTLQVVWQTKTSGNLFQCADIQLLGGKIEDCSGQCMNGGVCLNGECQCRNGFEGNFCQITTYVPDKTNYSLYLKYFLVFIVMIIIIIGFLFGAYVLYKNSQKINDRIKEWFSQR